MSFADIARKAGKLASDNSPAILSGLAVTGALATAYLAGRAGFKAAQIIDDLDVIAIEQNKPPYSNKEKFLEVWQLFIPAAGAGVMTVVCIIGSNHISNRRAAAFAAAYSVLDRGFTEYKEKVVEKLGERKETAIRDEIAQDHIQQNPTGSREIVITGGGEVLCRDEWSGRYFTSSMEEIKKAQNDVNYTILHDNYASLNDFYQKIGLGTTAAGDEFGWNLDRKLEIEFSVGMSDDQRPCISMNFHLSPIRGYHRLS